MKNLLIHLALCLLTANSYASSESLTRAANSKNLKELEQLLVKKNFALKSITDIEAGEGYSNRCGCANFTVTFQKAIEDEHGSEFVKTTKNYSLKLNFLSKEETITEIK